MNKETVIKKIKEAGYEAGEWIHPSTGKLRIYINGVEAGKRNKRAKFYFEESPDWTLKVSADARWEWLQKTFAPSLQSRILEN